MRYIEKLREFQKPLPLLYPCVIQKDFFTEDECNDITQKVLNLESYWSLLGNTVHMLPRGLYAGPKNTEIRSLMYEHFSKYYQRIIPLVDDYFNVESRYDVNYNYPGFHIFKGPLERSTLNMHNDVFSSIPISVYSLTIPICLPLQPCGLTYVDTEEKEQEYIYTPGTVSVWSGNILHSIGPFVLDKNEFRITMQLHVFPKPNRKATIFW